LENYANLEQLNLNNNKLGREGCRSIAKLLEKGGSRLNYLELTSNDLGDEEAEILANSLKCNTSLDALYLRGNNFGERGFVAFLKLLNNASSIDSTYTSNHTLKKLLLPSALKMQQYKQINSAIQINKGNEGNSHAAGRAKVIATQLNSNARMDLCRLQGVDYSYGSIFAEIKPILFPEVLSLTGGNHGQNELYEMLLATVPDLVSIVNREGCLKQKRAENSARISALVDDNFRVNQELASIESAETNRMMQRVAALTAELHELNKSLASVDFGETNQQIVEDGIELGGRKRGRA
jgi:hypothetical protein